MQLLRIALQQAAGRPIRTLLSILTLTLAVTALIAIAAASSSVTAVMRQSAIQQSGAPTTVLVSGFSGSVGLSESKQIRDQLERDYGYQHVGRVAHLASAVVDHAGVATPLEVRFVDPAVKGAYEYVTREGDWLHDAENALAVRTVVNEAAKTQLGLDLGETFDFSVPGTSSTTPAQVSGVIQDSSANPQVYVAVSNAEHLLRSNTENLQIQLVVSGNGVEINEVVAQLGALGGNYSAIAFETQQTDSVDRLTKELTATTSAFTMVGLFSLLAGVIGLANIGLAGVREQSAELSLRRAMGARWWHLPVVMVMETQLIAIVSTVFAVVVSRLLYPVLAQQLGGSYGVQATPFPWGLALQGLAVSVVAAAVASLAPALRSLGVPIASVMRAE